MTASTDTVNKALEGFAAQAIEAWILAPGDTLSYHPGSRINAVPPSITRTDATGARHGYTLFQFGSATLASTAVTAIDAATQALRAANSVRGTK